MSQRKVRPFNQRVRIAVLRAVFVIAVPLLFFTGSAWENRGVVFELLEVIGILLVIVAVLGRFWAILYIGGRKNGVVMTDGPYSVCRHPLYLFSTIGAVGFGLMLGSLVLTVVLGAVIFAILSATAGREERYLRHQFGSDYDAYARRVPRILPRPSLFRSPEVITVNLFAVRTNLRDALVFLSLIPIAELLDNLKLAGLWPTLPLW